jgi:hypothetical protein
MARLSVATGTPEEISAMPENATRMFLKPLLAGS